MVNFKENEELKTLNHSCAHLCVILPILIVMTVL